MGRTRAGLRPGAPLYSAAPEPQPTPAPRPIRQTRRRLAGVARRPRFAAASTSVQNFFLKKYLFSFLSVLFLIFLLFLLFLD